MTIYCSIFYHVIFVVNKRKLMYPVKQHISTIQYYVSKSELFQELHEDNLADGYGWRNRMLKELSAKYKKVTRLAIELYILLCEQYQEIRKDSKNDIVLKPMNFFSVLNSLCHVDITDFQPLYRNKFMMVQQAHLKKLWFSSLRRKNELEK